MAALQVERENEGEPFAASLSFKRKPIAEKAKAFALSDVALLPGVFAESAAANLRYLQELDADRLLHNFRINAGLPSKAQPLGGWEKPDCELRGHFVGHYLSACALAIASGDSAASGLKSKANYIVTGLNECQQQLSRTSPGYLSAFPLSYFDRLDARTKVWAPFYTIHKIMAGLYDMATLAGNRQALEMVKGMAGWADIWTASKSEAHMQSILDTEYGGMNDVLYDLAALTGDDHYIVVGDRFTKKKFFNPLALRRDELQGLHANTHIPQVIGAARRYELTGDKRFRDVAEFFWSEIQESRSYVTGGTSNDERWLVKPAKLSEELSRSTETTEDCCAYNMLKLTRHLYQWSTDPRYFDYYERVLLNHRLPAIDRKTGATPYYLSLSPGAWKTFNTANDSFWCCTGTGAEEFAKLNDSIYFNDGQRSLFVNLYVPSRVQWRARGLILRQESDAPESESIWFTIETAGTEPVAIHFRIPSWVQDNASIAINGQKMNAVPGAGSYCILSRHWKPGDRIDLQLPMRLRLETMPDNANIAALLYGPLVLAGDMGANGLMPADTIGHPGPDMKLQDFRLPILNVSEANLHDMIKPVKDVALTFRASSNKGAVTFAPFYRTFNTRYSIYWQLA